MSLDTGLLATLMVEAVVFSVRHVEVGGLPFVGLLVAHGRIRVGARCEPGP